MKVRSYKLVMEMTAALINLLRTVNIHKVSMDKHTASLKIARDKIESYTQQYRDADYMKTLSPLEQKCLGDNAKLYYDYHEQLRKELDYLDMSKHTQFVINTINLLERVFVLTESIYKEKGECADVITIKFTGIKLNDFEKAIYSVQIGSLWAELESFTYDLYQDHIDPMLLDRFFMDNHKAMHTYMLLTEALAWLDKERERIEKEGMPEIREIKAPKEIVPELPKGPKEVTTN